MSADLCRRIEYSTTGGLGTASIVWACGRHNFRCLSLRGTNRHRRVETVECVHCGERRRRVWSNLPKQGRPDREWSLGESATEGRDAA